MLMTRATAQIASAPVAVIPGVFSDKFRSAGEIPEVGFFAKGDECIFDEMSFCMCSGDHG